MCCGRVGHRNTLSRIVRIDCAAQPVGFLRLHHAQEPNRYRARGTLTYPFPRLPLDRWSTRPPG